MDKEQMIAFREIREFWANRFSSLSLSTFESNQNSATDDQIPGCDDPEWEDTPSGVIFASNLVVTADCFYNVAPINKGHSQYSYGMSGRIHRETGELYDLEDAVKVGDVKKCAFVVEKYGVEVDFDGCNGTVELIWDTEVI